MLDIYMKTRSYPRNVIVIISIIGQLASFERDEHGYWILQVNAPHTIGWNAKTTNYFTHIIRFMHVRMYNAYN